MNQKDGKAKVSNIRSKYRKQCALWFKQMHDNNVLLLYNLLSNIICINVAVGLSSVLENP